MINAAALLAILSARDVRLALEDGRLKLSAPAGALDDTLKAQLKAHRDEIIAFLEKAGARDRTASTIVPIKGDGDRPPVFAVSGHSGDIYYLLGMSRALHPAQPLIGIQPLGLAGTSPPLTTVTDIARYEITQLRRVQPHGPYRIIGHCAGGTIAFEIAHQLRAAGETIAFLGLVGAPFPTMFNTGPQLLLRMRRRIKKLREGSIGDAARHVLQRARERLAPPPLPAGKDPASETARLAVEAATVAAVRAYRPRVYDGQLDLFVTSDSWHRAELWSRYARATREQVISGFEIDELLLGPHARLLGEALQRRLDTA